MTFRLLLFLVLPLWIHHSHSQDDVECLREIKSSVSTTGEYLQSWQFNTTSTPPDICNFIGVQCLHPSEFKVYSLSLPGAGLKGAFPRGLSKCTSLTGLDLSSNFLTGPIPPELCKMVPYLVKLDLSQNNISGGIPPGLADCLYLNELRLQRNKLEGLLPGQIGLLPRLRDFNVADNRLSGPIPYTFRTFPEASFQNNNPGLCGAPLGSRCTAGGYRAAPASHRAVKARTAVLTGVAAGCGVLVFTTVLACMWIFYVQRKRKSQLQLDEEVLDNSWLKRITSPSSVVVNMFEQPIVKIRLSDLAAATSGFSREAVIGIGRTGVFYKATLRDGSVLSVKKLRKSAMHAGGERHFKTEMEALAKVRHRNLVPLLGYCIAGNERLMVYKHMPNGSLYSRLHGGETDDNLATPESSNGSGSVASLDWSSRLRIAVGAARGLAWLHHSCNPKLVHKGITSSCILLDEDLEPRITDFGLGRLIVSGRNRSVSSSSSGATATGMNEDGYYIPPEDYSTTYSLSRTSTISSSGSSSTPKGDVYAFGVVLLELVTGRKPNDGNVNGDSSTAAEDGNGNGTGNGNGDGHAHGTGNGNGNGNSTVENSNRRQRSLVDWIGELFKSGHVSDAVDKKLVAEASVLAASASGDSSNGSSGRRREVMQVLKIACSCVLSYPKERPSMYEVYHMLRAVGEDYYPVEQFGGGGSRKAGAVRGLVGGRFMNRHRGEGEEVERGGVEDPVGSSAEAEGSPAVVVNENNNGVQMQRLDG